MKRLKLSYLDQYLLHWPFALKSDGNDPPIPVPHRGGEFDRYPLHLVWAQMEQLVDEGLVRSIGVSNWTIALLNDMLGFMRIKPVTNQFEISIYNPRHELVEFCLKNDVVPVGYRLIYRPPNTPSHPFQKCVLDDALTIELSQKYNATPAQILISWCLARKCASICKTITPSRMEENLRAENLILEQDDVERLNALPTYGLYCDSYEQFGIHIIH